MQLNRRDLLQRAVVAAPAWLGTQAWVAGKAEMAGPNDTIPPIRWSAEKKVSSYSPMGFSLLNTAHAPSLASEGSTLYLAHAGDAGSTLWSVWPFPAPNASDKNWTPHSFPDQVLPYGKPAKIHGAPACVRYGGYTAILATDENQHGVTCYFYDGNSWASIPVFSESGGAFGSPKAVVVGDQLEVFAAKDNVPRHAVCKGRIFDRSSWTIRVPVNRAFVDSLAVDQSLVIAVCESGLGDANRYQSSYSVNKGQSGLQKPLQRLVLSGNSPKMNDDGAVVFVHQDKVGYIYRGEGGNQLFYAFSETPAGTAGASVTLQPSVLIPGKSSELPGVTVVGDAIFLAYKGQSTHDMYMLRGDF